MSIDYSLPRDHRELARKVVASVRRYVPLLGLQSWDFEVVFSSLDDVTAECEASPEYFSAKLTFDLGRLVTRGNVDGYVRHELLHCIVWPLGDAAQILSTGESQTELLKKIEESVTSALERMPVWARIK